MLAPNGASKTPANIDPEIRAQHGQGHEGLFSQAHINTLAHIHMHTFTHSHPHSHSFSHSHSRNESSVSGEPHWSFMNENPELPGCSRNVFFRRPDAERETMAGEAFQGWCLQACGCPWPAPCFGWMTGTNSSVWVGTRFGWIPGANRSVWVDARGQLSLSMDVRVRLVGLDGCP